MQKWATWNILIKIFHKASAIPSQPSKNTVEWFQTRWNQEKTIAQTPPKPVELLLSLHKELQDLGSVEPFQSCRLCSPHLRLCLAGVKCHQAGPFPDTLQGWHGPSWQEQLLQSAACPQQHSHPAPWIWETPAGMEEKWLYCFHFYIWGTRYECKTGLQSNFFIILSCLKSFKNNFLRVIFVRGCRGSLWKSQRPRTVYKASILTV